MRDRRRDPVRGDLGADRRIDIAAISAIAQFLSLPYYPVWAVLVIALDVGVIWALTVHDPRVAR